MVCKVWTFWEEHKIWKNLPLKIWHYWVTSNFKWKIFSNFVSFSECPNFNKIPFFSFILRTWGFFSCLLFFFSLCEYSCYMKPSLFSKLHFSNGNSSSIPKKKPGSWYYIKLAACIKKPTQYSKGDLPYCLKPEHEVLCNFWYFAYCPCNIDCR